MDTNQKTEREAADTQAPRLVPPVDITEDADGILVRADLPGVSKDDLAIGIDGDTLTIEATMKLGEAPAVRPVYAEVRVAQYRRSFALSRDLDTGRIDAGLKDGVLTLRVPRAEEAKPRRIEVRVE